MSSRFNKVRFLSLVFIAIYMLGFIPQAVWAGQALPKDDNTVLPAPFEGYDLDYIYLFYDPEDEVLSAVANAVHEILTYRVNSVRMIPVSSYLDLEYYLLDEPWIAVYALHSGLNGVTFPDRNMSWHQFYQTLNNHRSTRHIVGMGNTLGLMKDLPTRSSSIYHCESEQIDGMLLIIYDLWTISEIMEDRAQVDSKYDRPSKDVKAMTIKIYGDNLNQVFKRTLEPINPVGEVDPLALEKRTEEMWARHKPEIRPAAYKMQEDGSLKEIPLDELPEDFSPVIKLSSPAELSENDYALGEIPLFSALRGPIGEIIDVLLNVLVGEGQTTISIPSEVVDGLMTALKVIEPLIGLVNNSDKDSAIKEVIDAIASEFPFIDEYKGYLNILMKALFNMRGDFSSLLEIVTELIVSLLPDSIPSELTDFIMQILGVNDGLWDLITETINSGKGVFDTIFSFFTKNSLSAILNKTLVAVLELAPSEVSTLLPRMTGFISAAIDFLATRDYMKFLTDVADDLLDTLVPMTGLEDVVGKIMKVVELAMTVVDLVDNFDAESIMDLVIEILQEFVPSGLVQDAETLARNLMDVVKRYKEGGMPDVNAFKSELESAISQAVAETVPESTRNVIRDTISLLGAYFNDAFDKTQLPSLFDVAVALVNEFAESATENGVTLSQTEELVDALNNVVKPILAVIAQVADSDSLKEIISQTVSNFNSEFSSIADTILDAIQAMDLENVFSGISGVMDTLNDLAEIAGGIINVIKLAKGQSFQGIMQSLLMTAGSILGSFPAFDDVPLDAVFDLLKSFFPDAFGIDPQDLPSKTEIINTILDYASGLLSGIIDPSTLQTLLEFFMDVKDIFTNGVQWLLGKIFDWLSGMLNPLFDELEQTIMGLFEGVGDLLGYSTKIPIGLGDWSLFDLTVSLGIRANFNIDISPLFDMISSMIFDARSTFSLTSVGDFMKTIFSFFEISPQFYAELGVAGFDSSKNAIMGTLLKSLGLEMTFEGSAHFVMTLFTFREGMFEWEDFFKIVEWGLHIKITLGKVFTLADLFTAGLGGGALGAVMEFLGLDTIKITIYFGVELDIVKKAATAIAAEVSSLTLAITFGISIHIPIDIVIVAIIIDGSMEIILTFFQDFASGDPMKIILRLIFTVKIKFKFLFFEDSAEWTWEPGGPWDLSPKKGEEEYEKSGVGFDTDEDGLSDEYEATIPGLDPNKPDTDDDGASDKLEVQTIGTDPVNPDSDNDGLLDGEEWELGTNPMQPDTDWDDISDYDEVKVYGTDPLSQDTDGDMLSDSYEIYTRWDMTQITPTVEYVTIGGVKYDDHTDPLNPDTDGDGVLDGQEGPMGAYYGLDSLYNDTEGSGMDPSPLIFNYGYTHPLDADTDDDSYLQLYNGDIDMMLEMKLYPAGTEGQEYPMSDGNEIAGFDIILYDDDGEPYQKHVYTNPCNPDTDGDTGVSENERINPPAGAWLNSDGYELAQDPPSDPTDGDSDDDGLLDGLEGVLRQDSNHTFYLDPDTDDDGLPDMLDLLLGTDPLSPDTDLDMVSDGDEFYIYGTSPVNPDTDFDGLTDGEELFFWHTNPFSDDSDGDGLKDGYEVLVTGSDPMDEDSDNDGLNDFEEFFIYYTLPFVYDSDGDGLSDGEEIKIYSTDPLVWDTDHDSITEPNEFGEFTWPMSDYQEIMIHGTNATEPDSDMDGLDDAIELYLGSGEIPWMDPIPLNATNPDTDGDLLLDGSELMLKNVSDIVYPYRGITIILRFNSSPVMADTDNDNLTDYQEIVVFNTNPANNDTDNDTITDWWEVWVYNTSAIYDDTDGDGLFDYEETLTEVWPYGPWPPDNWSIGMGSGDNGTPGGWTPPAMNSINGFALSQEPIYPTSATDPDSDNDWLPDGAEVYLYGSNPMNSDSDGDGVDDTYEFDTDYDGMPDGVEFQQGLQGVAGGGIMNPDSDYDGLLDGDEFYIYGTDPSKLDTDGDGYSDGLEIALGLDPLTPTSPDEFNLALATERGKNTMTILLPKTGEVTYQDAQLSVVNFTNFQDMWYRYNNGTGWSDNYTLIYNPSAQMWQSTNQTWPTGNITVQVFGRNMTGVIHAATTYFVVLPGTTPFPWLLIGAIAAAAVASVIILYGGYRKGLWSKLGGKVKKKVGRGKSDKSEKSEKDGSPDKSDSKSKPKKSTTSKKSTKTSPKKGKKGGD